MEPVQRFLSKAQAIPVIGPVAISPVKAVVSLAQAVASLALTFFFGICLILSSPCSPPQDVPIDQAGFIGKALWASILSSGMGSWGLAYSVSNALSLGTIGFYIEYVEKNPRSWMFSRV